MNQNSSVKRVVTSLCTYILSYLFVKLWIHIFGSFRLIPMTFLLFICLFSILLHEIQCVYKILFAFRLIIFTQASSCLPHSLSVWLCDSFVIQLDSFITVYISFPLQHPGRFFKCFHSVKLTF